MMKMRLFKSNIITALAVTAGLAVAGIGFAEDQPQLDSQVQALIKRLESAEKQIQTLSSELSKVRVQQNQVKPFPKPVQEPAQLPVSESTLPLAVDGVFGREELAAFEETATTSNDFVERLGSLEAGWAKFNAAEQKKKSDAAKKPTFKIGGRIHADYWAFPNASEGIGFFEHPVAASPNFGAPPENRAAFRRIRLEMKGDIFETMLWRMQIDFADPADGSIKDVYLGFKELPFNQQLLIGNQKRPLGLDHLNSSRLNVFTERPLVVETFNEDARRPGIAINGHTDDESFNWRYGAYFLKNITFDGTTRGNSTQMSLNARVAGSPWYDETSGGRGYFHWGLAGMVARPDGDSNAIGSNANEARFRTRMSTRSNTRWLNTGPIDDAETYEVLALETIFNHGPFQLVSEYQHNWLQREGGADLQFHGGYVFLSYFLTGEHIPYDRKSGTIGRVKPFENFFLVDNCCGGVSSGWGAWNVALRYDYLDLSDDNVLGGIGESWTAAMNWWWTPHSRLQFNASYGEIREHFDVGGFDPGHFFLLGTRFAVDF